MSFSIIQFYADYTYRRPHIWNARNFLLLFSCECRGIPRRNCFGTMWLAFCFGSYKNPGERQWKNALLSFRYRFGGGFRSENFHPSQNFLVHAWTVFRTFLMPAAANELSWWMAIFPSYYYIAILSQRNVMPVSNFQHRHAFNYSIIFIIYLHNSKQTSRFNMFQKEMPEM